MDSERLNDKYHKATQQQPYYNNQSSNKKAVAVAQQH